MNEGFRSCAELAPMPQSPIKNKGRKWPLQISYQKEQNIGRDSLKENHFEMKTSKYDGLSKKYIPKQMTQNFGQYGDK